MKWSTANGLLIHARFRAPDTDPTAVVAIVHGMGEHGGRYEHVARAFADAGFATVVPDMRGHGLSGGKRGHTPSFEALLDDTGILLSRARGLFPGLPLFLYGHSTGGNIVLNYILRRRPEIRGAIVTGPWLELRYKTPLSRRLLAIAMSRLWPSFTVHKRLGMANLTSDVDAVRRFREDPLGHDLISAGLFVEVCRAGKWALEHAPEFTLPLLIMHGGEDAITSAAASRVFAEGAPGKCEYILFEGMRHELHNEVEKDKVLRAATDWIAGRL